MIELPHRQAVEILTSTSSSWKYLRKQILSRLYWDTPWALIPVVPTVYSYISAKAEGHIHPPGQAQRFSAPKTYKNPHLRVQLFAESLLSSEILPTNYSELDTFWRSLLLAKVDGFHLYRRLNFRLILRTFHFYLFLVSVNLIISHQLLLGSFL